MDGNDGVDGNDSVILPGNQAAQIKFYLRKSTAGQAADLFGRSAG